MAASTWRMNGTQMSLAFFFCVLLLNHGVKCDSTDSPDTAATDSPADTGVTGTQSPGNPDPDSTDDSITDAPGATDGDVIGRLFHVSYFTGIPDLNTPGPEVTGDPAVEPEATAPLRLVLPTVECVDKDTMAGKKSVDVVVVTSDCEQSKALLEITPGHWCDMENCQLEIYQEDNVLKVASGEDPETLINALISGLSGESEVKPESTSPSSGSPAVFVSVLLTGLLLAAALVGGYCLKCRGSDPKGVRLAEEAYPAEDANQGNTLVSVAPLNPPAETPEKPSVNGDAPEEPKTPPPPTNGHSTAKAADTEL